MCHVDWGALNGCTHEAGELSSSEAMEGRSGLLRRGCEAWTKGIIGSEQRDREAGGGRRDQEPLNNK